MHSCKVHYQQLTERSVAILFRLFVHFLSGLFILLSLWVVWVLGINPLAYINSMQDFFSIIQVVLSLCWLSPLLYRSFLVEIMLFVYFILCFLYFWGLIKNIIACTDALKCFLYVSASFFIVSDLTLRSLTHFSWFLCTVRSGHLVSFFCIWISCFPTTIYYKDCPFSNVEGMLFSCSLPC
jgi:hypothetical protein